MNKAKQVKQHFIEAQELLEKFLSDEKNFKSIEAAGSLLVKAFRNGNKAISCGNGGSRGRTTDQQPESHV